MNSVEKRLKELEERVKVLEDRQPVIVGPRPIPFTPPQPPGTTYPNGYRCPGCGKWIYSMEIHSCIICFSGW